MLDALGRHATSINLGLAADSVAHADYRMADLKVTAKVGVIGGSVKLTIAIRKPGAKPSAVGIGRASTGVAQGASSSGTNGASVLFVPRRNPHPTTPTSRFRQSVLQPTPNYTAAAAAQARGSGALPSRLRRHDEQSAQRDGSHALVGHRPARKR